MRSVVSHHVPPCCGTLLRLCGVWYPTTCPRAVVRCSAYAECGIPPRAPVLWYVAPPMRSVVSHHVPPCCGTLLRLCGVSYPTTCPRAVVRCSAYAECRIPPRAPVLWYAAPHMRSVVSHHVP